MIWNRQLLEPGIGDDINSITHLTKVPSENIPEFEEGMPEFVNGSAVAPIKFVNNEAYACAMAMDISRTQLIGRFGTRPTEIVSFKAWNLGWHVNEFGKVSLSKKGELRGLVGINIRYSRHVWIEKAEIHLGRTYPHELPQGLLLPMPWQQNKATDDIHVIDSEVVQ